MKKERQIQVTKSLFLDSFLFIQLLFLQLPFQDDYILGLHRKILRDPVKFPEQ